MLISIHENNNAVNFSSKLDTPIILPKNATFKLLKAYIPRNHIIRIDATNNQIGLNFHNKRQSDSVLVGLTEGLYGVEAFLDHFEAQCNTAIVGKGLGQISDFNITATYLREEGVGKDCLAIRIEGLDTHASFWAKFNFSRNDANNDWNTDFVTDNGGNATYTITTSLDKMRCASLQNGGADFKTWKNHWGLKKFLTRNWWDKQKEYDFDATRDRPYYNSVWTGFSFKIGDAFSEVGKDNSFWIGLAEDVDAVDTSLCVDNDLSSLVNMKGVEACLVFYGETANGKNKGDMEIIENIDGVFTRLGGVSSSNPYSVKKNDFVCFILPENDGTSTNLPITYGVKNVTVDNEWRNFNGGGTANRPKPPVTKQYNVVGGFFNGSGTDDTILDMRFGGNPNMSYIAGDADIGSGYFSDYGKSGQIYIGGALANNKTVNESLGFGDAERLNAVNNSGGVIDHTFNNTDELIHYDNTANQPYINLNLKNLPISSIACADTDATTRDGQNTHHSFTRTCAVLPRYNLDGDGQYDNITIQADGNNESVIKLRNKDEITLNTLEFSFRNGDGTIPTDLAVPLGIVIDIDGEELN